MSFYSKSFVEWRYIGNSVPRRTNNHNHNRIVCQDVKIILAVDMKKKVAQIQMERITVPDVGKNYLRTLTVQYAGNAFNTGKALILKTSMIIS